MLVETRKYKQYFTGVNRLYFEEGVAMRQAMLRSMALAFIPGIRRIAPGMGGQKLFTTYMQFMESRHLPPHGA